VNADNCSECLCHDGARQGDDQQDNESKPARSETERRSESRIGRGIAKTATRAIKQKFDAAHASVDAAHRDGMDALKRGDYEKLGEAITRERDAIAAIPRLRKPRRKV
jgi:hypothetical protein